MAGADVAETVADGRVGAPCFCFCASFTTGDIPRRAAGSSRGRRRVALAQRLVVQVVANKTAGVRGEGDGEAEPPQGLVYLPDGQPRATPARHL